LTHGIGPAQERLEGCTVSKHAIGIKLAVAFGLLVSILVGVGWLGLSRMRRINADLNEILNRRWSNVELSLEGLSAANSTYRLAMNVVLLDHRDPKTVDALLAMRNVSSPRITVIETKIEEVANSDQERKLLARIRETRAPARKSLQHLLDMLVKGGRPEAARSEMVEATIPLLNTYHATWNDFIQFEEQEMAKDTIRAQESYAATRRLTSLLIVLAIFVAIGIGVYVTRALTEEAARSELARLEIRRLNEDLERKVEERTRQLARLAAIVDFSGDAIVGSTVDGVVRSWNLAAERMFGYSAAEIIGRPVGILAPPDRPLEVDDRLETLRRGETGLQYEALRLRKDGKQIPVAITLSAIKDPSSKIDGFAAVARDITEQKFMEKQLRQAQKMEAIGKLSGGIAHDFNNLLSVIIGYSEIIEESLPESDPLYKKFAQIKKAGQSAASLTRQLLAFSRQQVLEPKILDMNAIVFSVEKMLRRLIGEHIALHTSLDPKLGRVKADQGQMEQVILNLVVNARDAMPQGGRLTIETANVDLDEDYSRRHVPQQPGPYVRLTVSDTGIGMDAQTQSHIFEPFFTTKDIGKGTGLGLSTVYGVVRQSKGHIWVYSEPGLGTAFKIYLPLTSETVSLEKPIADLVDPFHGTETILLVEDDESVRELARTLLEDGGYAVLEADRPERATEIARQHSGPIHLLLTDVIMPGINGPALARNLALLRPEMRVLYMSGYTGFTHPKILDSEAPHLSKPFTRETLLRKLHEELARERRTTA
jgi:PAS domain S-box-containing protein